MFNVYVIINTINGKLYIGKTNNLKRRWAEHLKVSLGGKEKYGKDFRSIHAAINKYKIDNFIIVSLEEIEDEICAYESEKFWISYFDSKHKGYNESPGGDGFQSGKLHYLYGKHPSELTREKLRKARIGKKPSLGKKASKETKEKMSEARSGDKNPMFGKSHTLETKNLIRKTKLLSNKNKGDKHYLATLSFDQAQEIRRLFFVEKKTKSEIAKIFDTKWLTVHRIIMNITYKI